MDVVGAGLLAMAIFKIAIASKPAPTEARCSFFLQERLDNRQDYVTDAALFKPSSLNSCAAHALT
jgi:hypothetical protein